MTTAMTRCTGEAVSWLRLEQHALARDPEVARHLDGCAACRACFASIEADRGRIMPPLGEVAIAAAARRRRLRRTRWLGAATAVAAAAVVLLVVLGRDDENMPGIKGGDDLVLTLVRERAGEVVLDPTSYRDGDRFKALVTCSAAGEVTVELTVEQTGETFTPLAPASIRCGNRVPLPGAFSLTGSDPADVCVTTGRARTCAAIAPAARPD